MKNLKILLFSALVFFGGSIFAKLLGYLYKILIARTDVALYGTYSLSISIIYFLLPLTMLGLGAGILRYGGIVKKKGLKSNFQSIVLTSLISVFVVSLVFVILFFVFSNNIASFFGEQSLGPYLKVLIFLLPLLALSGIFSFVLRVKNKVPQFVLFGNVTRSFLQLLFLAILFSLGFYFGGIVISLILSSFISFVILFFYVKKYVRLSWKNFSFSKEILLFSLPLLPAAIFFKFLVLSDTIILGFLSDIADVAFYSVAVPTAQLVILFSTSLLIVFLPMISKKYSQKKNISKEYNFISKWIFVLSLPFTLFILFFSPLILVGLFGGSYAIATFPLLILSLSYLIHNQSLVSYNVLVMMKKTKLIFFVSCFAFFLNIILNFILIPLSIRLFGSGIYGASLSTLLSFLALSILFISFRRKILPIKREKMQVLSVLFASLVSVLAAFIFSRSGLINSDFWMLVWSFLIFVVIYLILVVSLKILSKSELGLIRKMLSNSIAKRKAKN